MESNDFLQMSGQKVALVLDAKDNVAVVLADVAAGDRCIIRGRGEDYELEAAQDVAFGHKLALSALKKDDPIYKYGEVIGIATEGIPLGGWIHTHNLYCARGM